MCKHLFILSLLLISSSLQLRSETFPQVIMPGDYPDPSVLRDGKDFYMTHSPFHYTPGFLIWHSTDLRHWTPICRALPEFEGSAMAPDLVKHGNRYYIYYPAGGTNWVTWADDIRGPWSTPIDLNVSGIDPGHIADNDGNRYLYVNEGEIISLAPDGLSTVGKKRKVYDGWKYPSSWETEGMYLESPKLFYHDGYYYLTSAEGGTAGPATSHMAVCARSRNVDGPWEDSPYNPIIHTYTADDKWWSKGHGTIVDDPKGNWWIIYHGYRNGYHTLGRSTLIEPLNLTSDGWFHTVREAEYPKCPYAETTGMILSDDFSASELGLQWTLWAENGYNALEFTGNSVKMKGKGTTPSDGRVMMVTAKDRNYVIETEVSIGKNADGGLLLYYSDKAYAGVTSDGRDFFIYVSPKDVRKIPNRFGRHFFIRLHNRGNRLEMSVSPDGDSWTEIAGNVNVGNYHHNLYKGFYALRPALYAGGKGTVEFKDFSYSDGVPQEKDLAAYLMVFHRDETHGLHMALSRDGYTFTALNNGDPVMSGDTIAYQKGIRDPHIYRGPDGAFYVAMTDLHVFAQRDGYRDTQWERDGKEYGWGNNKGLVLMKSYDLIDWKRTNISLDSLSKGMKEIGCAWAPETIYDPENEKMMIYFTMRFGNEPNRLYYAYVNEDYDRFESLPQLLFEYPDKISSAIDGDITLGPDGQYHLFYVAHAEGGPGIKQAVAPSPTGPWTFIPKWCDFEPKACEAPAVWKRIGEDKWVLMYDVYSINPHNFGFVETSDFEDMTNLGHFNEGAMNTTNFSTPKHGAVVRLTKEEADRLERHWRDNPRVYVRDNEKPVKD